MSRAVRVRSGLRAWGRRSAAAMRSVSGVSALAAALRLPVLGLSALGLSALAVPAPALAQMPDLRQMSGQPLPSGDLPAGTVSVRVVREALGNNLAGVEVQLEGGARPLTARTDGSGRATFPNVPQGQTLRASVTVDGERLQSQPFVMPSTGGLRMLLAAGLGLGTGGAPAQLGQPGPAQPAPGQTGTGQAGPGQPGTAQSGTAQPGVGTPGAGGAPGTSGSTREAVPGEVTLGGQSRIIIELVEEALEVYGLFELVNLTASPVMPAKPIIFDLPTGARNASVLEGSTPLATADGNRIVVNGPFPPGSTPVQIAYRQPFKGGTLTLSQLLPLRLGQTTVIVRKVEGLQVDLPGATGQRDVPLEGRMYLVLNGGPVEIGAPVRLTLSGLPHTPMWPRNLALGLALAIVLGSIVLATRGRRADEIRALQSHRTNLFDQLVQLERRRVGAMRDEPGLRARRDELMAEIEEVDESLAETAPEQVPVDLPASVATSAQPPDARPVAR